MDSSSKFWAIFWICIVILCGPTEGWVWPVCLTAAIAAVALSPTRRDEE